MCIALLRAARMGIGFDANWTFFWGFAKPLPLMPDPQTSTMCSNVNQNQRQVF